MKTCTMIIGNNTNGIIALNGDNQLTSLDDYKNTSTWRDSTQMVAVAGKQATNGVSGTPAMIGVPKGMCGNSANGVVVFAGNSINYLSCLGNTRATWKSIADAPFTSKTDAGIIGMVGDPVNGLTAFGKDANGVQQVMQLLPSDDVPAWKAKVLPPFVVKLIAGETTNGVMVVGDKGSASQYSRSGPDCNCEWKAPVTIPFKVEMLCGDFVGGFVFYGEGQMMSVDPKGNLARLPNLNFSITAMTGNQATGVAAILVGGAIAYCADWTKAQWIVVGGPAADVTATATTGTSVPTPAPSPAPAAATAPSQNTSAPAAAPAPEAVPA